MKKIYFFLIVFIGIFGIKHITCVAMDTLPPNPVYRFCACCGGTHDDAYVEDMPLTYERSRLDTIILHKESFNYDFSYQEFMPGIDFRTKWYANVQNLKKDAYIKITFIDCAGNDTTIQNYYYKSKIAIRPDLDFGLLSYGEIKELDCWIINEATFADTITRIKLKGYEPGFEIYGINLPLIIPAGDSIKFKVRFIATYSGDFSDSIGYETYCDDDFLIEVRAVVGSPRIDVTNHDYGIRDVNSTSNCSILIWNLGITELIVTGFKGPKQIKNFIPYFNDINVINPLVIKPREVFSCEVLFIPSEDKEYADTISFISNTEKVNNPDSIAELFGRGISYPIIDVSDAYFGNVWQNKPVTKSITVGNVGLKELVITSYDKPENSIFTQKFDREINPDNPLILQPSDSWSFEIEFCSPNECSRIQVYFAK
ncbi:MAG: hypothetical protein M1419_01915, partial [Bacteroidetes bacterium]|nr:hypothetical protein [Bacteroidota bacterium]